MRGGCAGPFSAPTSASCTGAWPTAAHRVCQTHTNPESQGYVSFIQVLEPPRSRPAWWADPSQSQFPSCQTVTCPTGLSAWEKVGPGPAQACAN